MQAGHWGFIEYRPPKKNPEYRPNIDHTALYRPQKFLEKCTFTIFTFKSWDIHILGKWGLSWNMRDKWGLFQLRHNSCQHSGILMEYRPFWCNIDHKFKNIDHLSKMVDYRPMVANIDPVASLIMDRGPIAATWADKKWQILSQPSLWNQITAPNELLGKCKMWHAILSHLNHLMQYYQRKGECYNELECLSMK